MQGYVIGGVLREALCMSEYIAMIDARADEA